MGIICVGGANIDRKYVLPGTALPQTSNPATASAAFGGVARNIAENLARLDAHVGLLAVVGDDADGHALTHHAADSGIDVTRMRAVANRRTTEYAAIIDGNGDLTIGVNDMSLLNEHLPTEIERYRADLERADWLFMDCNLSQETLATWLSRARAGSFRLAVDAVSEPKVQRLPGDLHGIDVLFLNDGEARAYLGPAGSDAAARAALLVQRGATTVVLTLGGEGLILADGDRVVQISAIPVTPVDVTGAGDALVAAMLHRLLAGDNVVDAAWTGTLAAALTIESTASVRPDLSAELLRNHQHRLGRARGVET